MNTEKLLDAFADLLADKIAARLGSAQKAPPAAEKAPPATIDKEPPAAATIDKETVRDALAVLQEATDVRTAKSVLAEFGAKSIGTIDESDYAAVIARCAELT